MSIFLNKVHDRYKKYLKHLTACILSIPIEINANVPSPKIIVEFNEWINNNHHAFWCTKLWLQKMQFFHEKIIEVTSQAFLASST